MKRKARIGDLIEFYPLGNDWKGNLVRARGVIANTSKSNSVIKGHVHVARRNKYSEVIPITSIIRVVTLREEFKSWWRYIR